jgi:hypothetical protein
VLSSDTPKIRSIRIAPSWSTGLLAVDQLGHAGAAVPYETGDLLDGVPLSERRDTEL